jgi:hypothetical protein
MQEQVYYCKTVGTTQITLQLVKNCFLFISSKHGKDIILGLTNKIRAYRNNWLDHLKSTTPERIPYKLLKYKPKRKRSRGRQKKI